MTKTDEKPTHPGFGGMYNQFKTDDSLETKGVEIDYGTFRVTIARAGGANKKYAKLFTSKTQPYRRAMQTETMDDTRAEDLMYELYAEAIVLRWEVKVGDEWVIGIESPEPGAKPMAFTRDNIIKTFQALPDLFTDIRQQSEKVALFRMEELETDAGN